jgi:hypothetical protein
MARTHYRNGHPIDLRTGCNGCSPSTINGMLCHEAGCPDEWRDVTYECRECGCDFSPESRWDTVCDDCLNPTEDFDEADQPGN